MHAERKSQSTSQVLLAHLNLTATVSNLGISPSQLAQREMYSGEPQVANHCLRVQSSSICSFVQQTTVILQKQGEKNRRQTPQTFPCQLPILPGLVSGAQVKPSLSRLFSPHAFERLTHLLTPGNLLGSPNKLLIHPFKDSQYISVLQ